MMETADTAHAIFFYTGHPISAEIILKKVEAVHGGLDGVPPETLFAFDQDHYGGLAVNDRLAERAGMRPGLKVADFCAGLGGPARYFAHRYGVDVTGIELTPARVAGAERLTRLVGLERQVRVIEGNVMAVPLAEASVDIVVSQEAFLHVPGKGEAVREAYRILKPGGRLVFTDWTPHRRLAEDDARLMWEGLAAQTLQSVDGYRTLLEAAGFRVVAIDDLTAEWGVVLAERLAMYQKLRREAEAAGTASGHDAFHRAYIRFVAMMQARILGGARFTAEK